MRRLGSHGAKGPLRASGLGADRDDEMMDHALLDVTAEELQEFLEADTLGVRADQAFKERLRRELWEIVRSRLRRNPHRSDGKS